MADGKTEQEWPYLVEVEEIQSGTTLKISPDEEQREALVRRLGVLDLTDLSASITLDFEGGVVHASGQVRAEVTQECVVSMEPVKTTVEDEFEAWFADPGQAVSLAKARHEKLYGKGGAEVPILEEQDDPEPIVDGMIDLGELATQFLSLAIPPYPHAEGVEYEVGDDDPAAQPSGIRKNPFAALKDWKEKQEK